MRAGATSRGLAFSVWPETPGPWVILTHGAFLSSADFNATAEALSNRFKVLVWDLPGHGSSRPPLSPARLDTASDALIEVMDHCGVSSAVQLGFSFGGMIAQNFARRYPARTNALIAYGCVPIFLTPTPMRPLLWALMRLQFATQPWARFVETFVQQATTNETLQRELSASLKAQPPALRDAIWEAMLFGASNEPDFSFSCSAGHIMGANDDRFPGAYPAMKAFAARLPEGHAVEIAGAGHMAHREAPAAFIEALGQLITRVTP